MALWTGCALALTIWLAAPLGAQIRGSTWVRATVLPVQQSREALDAGLTAVTGGRPLARSSLATIRVTAPEPAPLAGGAVPPSPFPASRVGAASEMVTAAWPVTGAEPTRRRRSTLVLIDFLRN